MRILLSNLTKLRPSSAIIRPISNGISSSTSLTRSTPSPTSTSTSFIPVRFHSQPFTSSTSINQQQQSDQVQPSQPEISEKYYAITLKRSLIGVEKKRKELAQTLGFKRRQQTIIRPVNGAVAGMILRLKELVEVKLLNSDEELVGFLNERYKKPDAGFVVSGKMNANGIIE